MSPFNDGPVFSDVRIYNSGVCCTPAVTMQTPHHLPKPGLKEHNGIRAAMPGHPSEEAAS